MQEINHKKILVIKLGALGDFIQALGPMAAIRKHHPKAEITLMTTKPYEEFAKNCGYFSHIWIDEKPGKLNISGWVNLRKKLSQSGFTRVYDLQNNDRTSLYLKLLSGPNKPEWVGAAKGASHRNNSPERNAGHAYDGHVQTLGLAGIKDIRIDDLSWMKADIKSFDLHDPYVLFIPGSAPNHPKKRWPAKHYSGLAKTISSMGYQIVLLGTNSESAVTAEISKTHLGCLDLTGQTSLFQIAVLARNASAAIGNDTGPMHLIAATGCPCLALYSGRSNPVKHGLKGGNVQMIQKENLEDLMPEEVFKKFTPKKSGASQSAVSD
ncbi:MAG: glycosyl transferase [Micavibrio sp.]|nr:MAG: glycosyl transferase [Micavibrio sp.]